MSRSCLPGIRGALLQPAVRRPILLRTAHRLHYLSLKAGGGTIVNVSSMASMVSIVGAPKLAYVGSTFAYRGMTRHVAVQYGPDNIRINSVHPGYIKTPTAAASPTRSRSAAWPKPTRSPSSSSSSPPKTRPDCARSISAAFSLSYSSLLAPY